MSRIVYHLVDGTGTAGQLWGKERVIADVVTAQRTGGVDARLICFVAGALASHCRMNGVPVRVLEASSRRLPHRALPALLSILREDRDVILHTHGYKANVVGRFARLAGARVSRLVATCHGWPDETRATRLYNRLDRWSAFLSDTTTVPDDQMLERFPRFTRGRAIHVANAIPDRALSSPAARRLARERFGLGLDAFVVGTAGRYTTEKGICDVLHAACDPRTDGIVWSLAGSGPLEGSIRAAGDNVHCAGYVAPLDDFLDGIDAYVQASHSEGLSLALLEAMRAGLPIVATDVGATSSALAADREGLIVPPRDLEALVCSVVRLRGDASLRSRLGTAARKRFERQFRIDRVLREFASAYRLVPCS